MTTEFRLDGVKTIASSFFLLVKSDGHEDVVIDLDEQGWLDTYAEPLRRPGRWFLCSTIASARIGAAAAVLAMEVRPGEVPYYRARHIGDLMNPDNKIVCHGIGKKDADGNIILELWRMPNGMVVGKDDVYDLGVAVRDKTL